VRNIRKPDRLTNPDDFGVMRKMGQYYSLQPLDEVASQMDSKWGADRLPRLVSVKTATRFGSALNRLNNAIDSDNHKEVEKRAKILILGWRAMDAEAEEMGAAVVDPKPTATWRDDDGNPYALFQGTPEAIAYSKSEDGDGVRVITLKEVARIVGHFESKTPVAGIRGAFGGAEIITIQQEVKNENTDV